MTCCTVNNCTSWLHCGSACDWKDYRHLQTSWNIDHKTFDLTSLLLSPPLPDSLSRWLMKKYKWRQITALRHFPFLQQKLVWFEISDALIHFCEILLQTRSNHAWPTYLPDLAARHTHQYITIAIFVNIFMVLYLWITSDAGRGGCWRCCPFSLELFARAKILLLLFSGHILTTVRV